MIGPTKFLNPVLSGRLKRNKVADHIISSKPRCLFAARSPDDSLLHSGVQFRCFNHAVKVEIRLGVVDRVD